MQIINSMNRETFYQIVNKNLALVDENSLNELSEICSTIADTL